MPVQDVYQGLDRATVHVFQEQADAAFLEKSAIATQQILATKRLDHFEFIIKLVPLLLILNINYFDCKRVPQFLVIGQLNDAAISGADLAVVFHILGEYQFNFLVCLDVRDACLVHAQIHTVGIDLNVLAITITKMQIEQIMFD